MRLSISSEVPAPAVYGPDPIVLEGRSGCRYWVDDPFEFTGVREVDQRLSGYPVAVFQPPGRPPGETPVVVGLQGMAAPYQWNGFIVPTLLDLGIACVLFDTPAAGERSVLRRHDGDIVAEVQAFVERGVPVTATLVLRLFQAVARDFGTVLRLAGERHGLTHPRRALFGVSLGVLLSAFAFLREGVGQHLLGAIGHANLPRFARSYTTTCRRVLASLAVPLVGRIGGPKVAAGLSFLRVLNELTSQGELALAINPMSYADRAGPARRVRFLVGDADPLVRTADAVECARRFPDGACYVVPGLGHGGDGFMDHVRYFLATQLGDWKGAS
jgi:hypothetical protein